MCSQLRGDTGEKKALHPLIVTQIIQSLKKYSKKHYQFIDFLYFNKANTWCIIQGNRVWPAQGSHTRQSQESEAGGRFPETTSPELQPGAEWTCTGHPCPLGSLEEVWDLGGCWWPIVGSLTGNPKVREGLSYWSSIVTCFRHGNRKQIRIKTLRQVWDT